MRQQGIALASRDNHSAAAASSMLWRRFGRRFAQVVRLPSCGPSHGSNGVKVEILVKVKAEEIGRGAEGDWSVQQVAQALHRLVADYLGEYVRIEGGRGQTDHFTSNARCFKANLAVPRLLFEPFGYSQ